MSVRTIVKSGVTWEVRAVGDGREEWTRIAGQDAVGEFRIAGRGSCGIVDRPARATRSTHPTRTRATSPQTSRRIDGVVLTAQARQMIIEELMRFEDGEHVARESGGWLVGRDDGSTVVITAAYGAGPDAEHRYGAMTLPFDYARVVANSLRAGERICGDFHSHSNRGGPSPADKRGWAGLSRQAATPWCGLLVARNARDWAFPVFAVYVSSGDEHRATETDLEVQRWRQY